MKQFLFLLILSLLGISCFAQRGYIRDAYKDKYGTPGAQKGEAWMKNVMNARVEPEYRFPVMMQMHMTGYDKGKPDHEQDITYYFNTAASRFAMRPAAGKKKKDDRMLIIYDQKANSMIMLNETEHTGMAMNMNAFLSGEAIERRGQEKEAGGDSKVSCRKTGKTKTIQGYSCEEYVCVNKEDHSRSELWISGKMPFDISQSGSRGAMAAYFGMAKGLGGMMMEGSFFKNDVIEAKMEVIKVNEQEHLIIKTGDYKFGMR